MWPSMYGTIYVCEWMCMGPCACSQAYLNIPMCMCLHTHVVSKCVWALLHVHGPLAPRREPVDPCLRQGLGAKTPSMTTPVPLARSPKG